MSILTIILIIVIAFLAGMESVLDQFQFHQPIVSCTLIGLATFDPTKIGQCILLGGTLQMIALGWMNIGAAVAPDAALAGVIAGILVAAGGQTTTAVAVAIPLSVAGLVLTILVRTINTAVVHNGDKYANSGNARGLEITHYIALALQGLRVVVIAVIVIISQDAVMPILNSIPTVISVGLSVGGGMIVVVGYAMVINMMATKSVWPFFFLGFALSVLTELNLIAMGIIGLVLALVYLELSPKFNGGTGQVSGGQDNVDQILNNF